jgi:hypothetical protein
MANSTTASLAKDYQNTNIHTTYNISLNSAIEKCHAMLLAMNHLAHVHEITRTINAALTNVANALVAITPTIRILLGSNFVTMACPDIMLGKLVDTVKGDIKHGTYELTKKIMNKLKETPEAGSDEEINTAQIIVKAYLKGDN